MAEYINREDAKKSLIGWDTDPTDEEIEYALDNIPTADVVEVVHGYWEEVIGDIRCSVCKISQDNGHKHNYCPECGAKMDGERRSEE